MEPISLLELFTGLELSPEQEELLSRNTVENVDLRPDEREVYVCVRSSIYLPLPELSRLGLLLKQTYRLKRAEVRAVYGPELLPTLEFSDLTGLLAGYYPPATAVLAGCRWEAEGDCIHIHLKGNGVDDLKPHLRHVSE